MVWLWSQASHGDVLGVPCHWFFQQEGSPMAKPGQAHEMKIVKNNPDAKIFSKAELEKPRKLLNKVIGLHSSCRCFFFFFFPFFDRQMRLGIESLRGDLPKYT